MSKTAQKQPKIILFTGMKLFEILKLDNYLINFLRILWFIWDLGLVLFDSHKDSLIVSGKIFDFGNILGFLGVNWAKNGPKPSTLGTSSFRLNT